MARERGGEFSDEGEGEFRDPVDVSTGQGAKEGGERGRAKGVMVVGDKTCKRERAQREKSSGGGGNSMRLGRGEKP